VLRGGGRDDLEVGFELGGEDREDVRVVIDE
jgi:hypothetical protein